MAVDSAAKRLSMMNAVSGFGVYILPMFEPDGAVDADDRAHLLNLYSGIAFDSPVAVTDSRSRIRLHVTTHMLAVS